MITGRTNQSAKLREGPSTSEPFFDELEPGYPLIIHGSAAGWLDVTAKAHGKRSEDQRGWISARLVTKDNPKPQPVLPPERPPRELNVGWIIGTGLLCIAASWGIAYYYLTH